RRSRLAHGAKDQPCFRHRCPRLSKTTLCHGCGDQYLSQPRRQARHRAKRHRSRPCARHPGAESRDPSGRGNRDHETQIDARRGVTVQDGRPGTDYRWRHRRPARFRQRCFGGGRQDKRHCLAGRGPSRYFRRPRRRSREHASQAARIFGGSRNRGHRARRPRAHHPHEPRRQGADPARLLRDRPAAGPPQDKSHAMTGNILVLNAGSSSIKFSLYPVAKDGIGGMPLCEGAADGIGHAARFHAAAAREGVLIDTHLGDGRTHEAALSALLQWLEQRFTANHLRAAGHRVVHGGSRFTAPTLIDEKAVAGLRELIPLAPLHQPHAIAAIEALARRHPALPQIACFDTAFHHAQPEIATRFALPRRLHDEGVRRYGFHGLSYEYIASVLPDYLGPGAAMGRIVVAHLGSGASMCAMKDRKSVATTMGLTALDGLPMSRRCGTLDPGVVLYLLNEKKMDAKAVRDLLYNESGLLGVSGVSDDMRALLAAKDPRAAEAIALFVYRI